MGLFRPEEGLVKEIIKIAIGSMIGVLGAFFLVLSWYTYEAKQLAEEMAEAAKQEAIERGREACIRMQKGRGNYPDTMRGLERYSKDMVDCYTYKDLRKLPK